MAGAPTSSIATVKPMWCAPAGVSSAWQRSRKSWLLRAAPCPIRIKDIAEVAVGRELRTGSASGNGKEVVFGTALMLAGGNSRAVYGVRPQGRDDSASGMGRIAYRFPAVSRFDKTPS